MNQRSSESAPREKSALVYFAYAGTMLAVVSCITLVVRFRTGDPGWSLARQLVGVFCVTVAFLAATFRVDWEWMRRPLRAWSYAGAIVPWLLAALGMGTAFTILALDHRRYVLAFALLETVAIFALRKRLSVTARIAVASAAVLSWSLESGLTYVHLNDWLANVGATSAFAVLAFALSFAIVISEIGTRWPSTRSVTQTRLLACAAFVVFAACALRTDNLAAEWVPWHRSYFADPVQFLHGGHWLLWDVPSLYGFLSIATLALIPVSNGWQAVYLLTALFLVFQGMVSFTILRWQRSGWLNGAFAILFPLAMLFADNLGRYPWSARLYPQGGLRYFWLCILLFVAFLRYVWRTDRVRCTLLLWTGHVAWCLALLWSVDNALWTTIVWPPYVAADALVNPEVAASFGNFLRRLVARAWPLVALPALALATIDAIYLHALGVGPDWRSYIEFTGLFVSGAVRSGYGVDIVGPVWIIPLVLAAVGTLLICVLRTRTWSLLPLLVASWLAAWGTASYFALEPNNDQLMFILGGALLPVCAIALFVSRSALKGDPAVFVARVSIIPLAVIVIAFALGEPLRRQMMAAPLSAGWSFDSTQAMPPITGELASLMQRAGISTEDAVLFPTGTYWTEIDQGLILPFGRAADGKIVEYRSWLPTSPVGPKMLFLGLPPARAHVILNRFIDRLHGGGWYITYRSPAICRDISSRLRTIKTVTSPNFAASRCSIGN